MRTANTKRFRIICLTLLVALGLALTHTLRSSRASAAEANLNAARQLTVEERVAYQRAIEEVYWRGRIWPAANPQPKLSLDAVMPHAEIEAKVADYLRKSQAMEDHWQRPIGSEQLQAEMDRMARETKQPAVLAELHRALGNDPFVIAECLARPTLVERLIRNWYAHDERFHGELKDRAGRELVTHNAAAQLRQASGEYAEVEWVRDERAGVNRRGAGAKAMTMNAEQWEKLTRQFGQLREDEARYYVTMALEQGKDRMKVAVVEWRKEPFEQWWARVGGHTEMAEMAEKSEMAPAATGYEYRLQPLSATGTDNTWAILSGAPAERYEHTAVWTGSEVIVWGGQQSSNLFNTGGRYNPATDSWIATSLTGAPAARTQHTAVWTGTEMIVWGGFDSAFTPVNTGGRYNPASDSWTASNTVGAPAARNSHTAIWTGGEMIVWGGTDPSFTRLNSGGRYNPLNNTWTATSLTNAPVGRARHTAVWTGNEMIVWGGQDSGFNGLNTGGKYNPGTNSWTATSLIGAPAARWDQTAVWTGSEMIVWGGDSASGVVNTGGRYNPAADSWTATSLTGVPTARHRQTAVWTSNEMIVWGGRHPSLGHSNTGGRYNPASDSWVVTNTVGAPAARELHKAVWTGSEMIVWGGQESGGNFLNTGGRYNPASNSWIVTSGSTLDTPTARNEHTAVWTGSEMIIWGGQNSSGVFNTGGRYNPATGGWTPTNTTGVPAGRHRHTAVWTGSEMIVWGGLNNGSVLNTGGRYNPGTNSWVATSLANVPAARDEHTSVWTGSEMIVWGGDDSSSVFNTGGRYNPASNSWIATNTVGAPTARLDHTSVWTGSEMIVWGGQLSSGVSNTGSRYNPGADTWTAISLSGVPTARTQHTAVWTGSEMIVWGGSSNTGGRYNPASDSWIATNMAGVPDARTQHTVVWTGSEMIVWGGVDGGFSFLNTGGRYNPASNNWMATSLTDAPAARRRHTAVWTGNEMIVWGGDDSGSNFNNGGRYFAQAGTVNTPPTITGTALTRTAGSPAANAQIAAVDDAEDGASLTVTVNGVASATVNGVTVSGLSVNSSGQVTASVGAICTAATAAFTLRVTDSGGLFDEATLDITVNSNTPPSLGTYSATSVTAGGGITVTPNAAPTDNGSVVSLTASAPGFTGTLTGNPATGAITITNANPVSSYTVTVTATDNCGATSTATFSLTVTAANNPPTITGTTISRQKGSPASISQIATVGDANQGCNTLSVTVTPASGSGVTVSGISVNASCQVTASVLASCTATNSIFNLTVTDNQGATATALLTVNVTNNAVPSLATYPATGPINVGAGATVTPSVVPSDNGSITNIAATALGFTGTLSVNPTTGVVTIANAGPAGTFTVTVTATDNCGAQTTRSFTLTVASTGCAVTVNPAAIKQPYLAVPYVELLSASPAGNYTFSVSAGALPPGLQLATALGVTSIAGLPTTPGTYNFTIKVRHNITNCEGTRSYTVTIPKTVVPILECVQRNANGTYTARFGYDNSTGAAVTIPVGANNYFTPGSQNRGQTTVFQPGRIVNAFSVTFAKSASKNLAVWYLKGPDNVLRPVSVLTTSFGCP